jgi:hypothetical protein
VPLQGALWFAQGARFSVTAEQIRRRLLADYERLLASVNGSVDPSAACFLEVLWWYVITSPTDVACPQPTDMFKLPAKKPRDPVDSFSRAQRSQAAPPSPLQGTAPAPARHDSPTVKLIQASGAGSGRN